MSNGPSLVKQLTGAIVGGALGLIAYYGYEAAPRLTAWTSIPQQWLPGGGQGSAVADKDQAGDRTGAHFESRAKEISEKFGAAYKKYQVEGGSSSRASSADASSESVSSAEAMWSESSSVASVPAPSWIDGAASSWDDSAMEKAPGPDTDELPGSGIGTLGALIAAGMGAGGLRACNFRPRT